MTREREGPATSSTTLSASTVTPDRQKSTVAAYCDCRAEVNSALREREGPSTRRPKTRTTPSFKSDGDGQQQQDYDDDSFDSPGGQQTLESRKRAKIELGNDRLGLTTRSLEFLCEKYTEFNKEKYIPNDTIIGRAAASPTDTIGRAAASSTDIFTSGFSSVQPQRRKRVKKVMDENDMPYAKLLPLPPEDDDVGFDDNDAVMEVSRVNNMREASMSIPVSSAGLTVNDSNTSDFSDNDIDMTSRTQSATLRQDRIRDKPPSPS